MRKKTFLKIVEVQTEQSRKHLDEVKSIHKEMRGYKHDFHHHLQTLKVQLEMGEYDRAMQYIDELDNELLNVTTLLKTGNVALDAILSGKIAKAKTKGIELTVKANVPEGLALSDVELGIIIGNLLENAIEACEKTMTDNAMVGKALAEAEPEQLAESPASEKQPPAFIRLYIAMKGNMLYFSMMNTAGKKQKKLGKLFGTSKEGLHGFGLRRAEQIIAEHGGWCKYNSEDGVFTSEFLVPAIE